MAGNDGCLTIATLIPENAWSAEKEENLEKSIVAYLRRRDIDAIVKILPSDSVPAGAESLIKAYGFGPIVPNTIILGLTSQLPDFARYARMIHLANRCRRNLVILSESDAPADPDSQFSVIDIWWRGTRRNIGFMLAVSELLRRRSRRDPPKIRIKTIVDSAEEAREAGLRLEQLINEQRFEAEAVVLTRSESRSAYDVIRDSSADADLVFLGMRAPEDEDLPEHDARAYYQNLIESMRGFRAAALVLAAEDIHFESMTGGASGT